MRVSNPTQPSLAMPALRCRAATGCRRRSCRRRRRFAASTPHVPTRRRNGARGCSPARSAALGVAVLVAVLTGVVGAHDAAVAPAAGAGRGRDPPVHAGAAPSAAAGARRGARGQRARAAIVAQPSAEQQSARREALRRSRRRRTSRSALDGRLLPDLRDRPEHVRRQLAAARLDPQAGDRRSRPRRAPTTA